MRKEYGDALRRLFPQILKKHDTGLTAFKPPEGFLMPGERVFKKQMDSLSCFVVLVPHPMTERFTLEIGWSEKNQFPVVEMRPSGFLSADKREIKHSDFLFRIGDLLDQTDFWWIVEAPPLSVADILVSMEKVTKTDAEAKILPQVKDAAFKLSQNVLPFFNYLSNYKKEGR